MRKNIFIIFVLMMVLAASTVQAKTERQMADEVLGDQSVVTTVAPDESSSVMGKLLHKIQNIFVKAKGAEAASKTANTNAVAAKTAADNAKTKVLKQLPTAQKLRLKKDK
jgi:hypothetical protein